MVKLEPFRVETKISIFVTCASLPMTHGNRILEKQNKMFLKYLCKFDERTPCIINEVDSGNTKKRLR